jgi:hypothetical protein
MRRKRSPVPATTAFRDSLNWRETRLCRSVAGTIVLLAALFARGTLAQVMTTTVQGTVYRANGTVAAGTVLISWSSFTTPDNQAVAPGSLSATIGANGWLSVSLIPNAGALPAGSYYTAVYHLTDGTVRQDYWLVPASGTAQLSSVESALIPSMLGTGVSQSYVQSAIASATSSFLPLAGGVLSGPLTLSGDPVAANQAATKHYADEIAAAALPLAGGTLTGPLTLSAPPSSVSQAGLYLSGAFNYGMHLQTPPAGSDGSVASVGCGTGSCTQSTPGYNFLSASNSAGNNDVLSYNPAQNGWNWTAGMGTSAPCSVGLADSGLSFACRGFTSRFDTSGNLVVPAMIHAQGEITGATINGEITVDGITYPTLNAAWNAAAGLAGTSGQNQTIHLGPGAYPVAATLTEPANGACVNVLGSAGTTVTADSPQIATTLTVPASLGGDVFSLGNAAQAQGCTFRDLNLLAAGNATHGFELQWFRGLLMDNVTVNDTTAEGILLGEENAASGHQANFLLRNITVSYSSASFTPASRPAYGIHLLTTAMDSHLDNVMVRNALTAAIYNEGTGNTGYLIHGFGYPYTCSSGPCVNNAASGSAPNASYATSYVIEDVGGSGSVWTDTYADSPAVAGFYIGANGIEIHGGHIQWPDLASFPAANLAYVAANVSNNLLIADVDCLGMASGANWITYAGFAGNPPTYTSVHHLTGCGNYSQSLEPAEVSGFSSGGANINDPSGAVPRVWSTPIASAASYPAYSAQLYTGYQGDAFQAHFSGVTPFFNVTYQGTIRSSGGIALNTIINTAPTLALTAGNKNVIANAAGGAQTITLPSCYTALPDRSQPTGLEFTIAKSDTTANPVTLGTTSGQLIYSQGTGASTLAMTSPATDTLVCGPDYNWYVVGAAAVAGVASFDGRSGAVAPASGDYSFAQLSGQATNAQLPASLTSSTTGNAATASALAVAPSQCAAGSYATGIAANGSANCLQSWRFTWYGNFGGTFGTSTNNSLGAIWSPSASLTMTRLDIAVGTAPSGCSTWPVVGIYDNTAASWLKTVTLATGTYSYRNTAGNIAIAAGHNLSMGVQTAGVGCATNPGSAQLTMEYTMAQ